MDRYQSGMALGVVLLIIGVGVAVVGWVISGTEVRGTPDSYDYYVNLGLGQQIIIVGAIMLLVGVGCAVYECRAGRRRKRRLFCPYCGREVGPIGDECVGCGKRL